MTKRIKDSELDDITGGAKELDQIDNQGGSGSGSGSGSDPVGIIGDDSGGGRPVFEKHDGGQNVEGPDDITNMEQNG